jgi:hypothetical protein
VTAEEVNLLSSVNNVTAASQWMYPADLLDPFDNCAPGVDPVGFAIFQGNYGMNNYTSGNALPLYNTTIDDSCTVNFYPNEDVFQPMSDSISVYNDGQLRTNSTALASLSTDGYWTGGEDTPAPVIFHSFGLGVYTVIGADTWGNVLLLHFSVTTTTQTSTTTLTGTSSVVTNATTATIPGTDPPGICIDPGQSGGAFFRVLNDSTSLPVAGASVTAVADGSSPNCAGGGGSTAFHETYTFITNQTEWYSLDVIDIGSYNFTVTYSGHTYSFVISLGPVISSCGTLYLPSGRTSTPTYPEPGTACNSAQQYR